MALPSTCTLTPSDYSQGIAAQVAILRNDLIRFIAINDPYANVVEGGTTQNNAGEQIKTLVTSRLVTNQSLTTPAFSSLENTSCGLIGPASEVGQTQFVTTLQVLRGKGPTVCVNQSRFAVLDAYRIAEQNLKDAIKTVNAADIRSQLLVLSGVKAVLNYGATSLGQIITGGYNQVQTNFLGGVPTAPVGYKFLIALSNYMRDNLSPEFFGDGAGAHFIFVASSDQIEALRNDTQTNTEMRAVVTGSFRDGKDEMQKYAFIDYTYRGIKFAIDQQPLRFNTVNAQGFPNFIEPLVRTVTDFGVENRTNSAWVNANYEVGFLVSKGAFRRLVPERYVGEGTFKFEPQYIMGELMWTNYKDNQCNPWGDFGYHLYQIVRAFQARRPHGVVPVLYKRCAQDLGLAACSSPSYLTL